MFTEPEASHSFSIITQVSIGKKRIVHELFYKFFGNIYKGSHQFASTASLSYSPVSDYREMRPKCWPITTRDFR